MPGFDRTGPWGEGPMTGGARGYCNPGSARYGRGFGRGRGRGFRSGPGSAYGPGRGYGRGFGRRGASPARGGGYGPAYDPYFGPSYTMSREEEISMLKEQAARFQEELNAITKRMEELASESSE